MRSEGRRTQLLEGGDAGSSVAPLALARSNSSSAGIFPVKRGFSGIHVAARKEHRFARAVGRVRWLYQAVGPPQCAFLALETPQRGDLVLVEISGALQHGHHDLVVTELDVARGDYKDSWVTGCLRAPTPTPRDTQKRDFRPNASPLPFFTLKEWSR